MENHAVGKAKLLKFEELNSDTQAVYDVLNGESDLPCILIGTNFLDQILASLVEQTFIKSSVAQKMLNHKWWLHRYIFCTH